MVPFVEKCYYRVSGTTLDSNFAERYGEWLVLVALNIHHQEQDGTAIRIVLTEARSIRYTSKLGFYREQLLERVSRIGHVPQPPKPLLFSSRSIWHTAQS
jgi:hypothetical protein